MVPCDERSSLEQRNRFKTLSIAVATECVTIDSTQFSSSWQRGIFAEWLFQGILTEREGRMSTVDLLIKAPSFVTKVNIFNI